MARAVVVGAGVGGLAAAAALAGKGWDVTVYERAAAVENVGAGLAVAPNALQALDTLGLGDRIRALAALQGPGGIVRRDGRWLSRASAEAVAARYGDPTVVLRRTELVAALAGALPPGTVRFGVEVTEVDPETGTVVAGGRPVTADLVVAADGIGSAIRSALLPRHPGPAYAGVTSWRILAPGPPGGLRGTTETWGRGQVFGLTPLADGSVYAYATAVRPAGQRAEDERAELVRLFAGWHEPIPRVLAGAGEVVRTDIRYLPRALARFHVGRVVLLGDAAHAMPPNLGQGACQAIEDAVVLAAVAGEPDGPARYTAARLPRTTDIARRSLRICRLTRLSDPVSVALRDSALWLAGRLGPGPLIRQLDPVFGWRPPA